MRQEGHLELKVISSYRKSSGKQVEVKEERCY